MKLWSNVCLNRFSQINVGENVILECFVRCESFSDFSRKVLFFEQGLVKQIQYFSLALKAQLEMSSLGTSRLPRLEKKILRLFLTGMQTGYYVCSFPVPTTVFSIVSHSSKRQNVSSLSANSS